MSLSAGAVAKVDRLSAISLFYDDGVEVIASAAEEIFGYERALPWVVERGFRKRGRGSKENFIFLTVDVFTFEILTTSLMLAILAARKQYAEKGGIGYDLHHGMDLQLPALFVRF